MPTVTNNIQVSAVGASVLNTADPSAVTWIRVNADNTITYRTAAQTLSDLNAQVAGTYLVPADIGATVQGYSASTTLLGNSTTGTGDIVRATSPTIATSFTLDYGTASTAVYLNASKQLVSLANGSGVLTNDGLGGLTWAAASSGITINSTAITGGGANRILFENSSNQVSESATNFYFETGLNYGNCIFAPERTGTITTNKQTSAFGNRALRALTTGAGNTAFGARALEGVTTQSYNTAVGVLNGLYSPVESIFLGYGAGFSVGVDASYSIYITTNSTLNNLSTSNCIGIGYGIAAPPAQHTGILGGNNANGYISDWYFNGATHNAPYSVVLHACHGSGTNTNAANITLSGGAATGLGNGGFVKSTTSVKRASGTTLQVDTDRNVIVGKYVDITGGAATTFGQLALATSGTNAGGEVLYTIEANDGTDYQSLTGVLKYDVVNKAGTLTVTYSDVQNGAGACSAGTLTATVTAVVSGTNIVFQANAVSSLVETVLRVTFQVNNNSGQAIVTPA